DQIRWMVQYTSRIHVSEPVAEYVATLTHATRNRPELRLGASPRGSLALVRVAQAWAAADGRVFVTPDDVKAVAEPVLAHRLLVDPEAEIKNVRAGDVLEEVLSATPVPGGASVR
ncbi:MAG: AAA family ATPase, partial [Micromonosporaceae bacterium]